MSRVTIRLSFHVVGLLLAISALSRVALAGGPLPTPEIDAGSMTSAAALLIGGAALLADRFRRK